MLIVGLGNPGSRYTRTRHNVGFRIVDRVLERCGGGAWRSRFKGEFAETFSGRTKLRLLKPETYMNASGEAVAAARAGLKTDAGEILVVHDELDLPFGALRFKAHGGHGGHNGLRSIIDCLGDNAFPRLRFGIGHPGKGADVVAYVLGRFDPDQQATLDARIDAAAAAVETFAAAGFDAAARDLAETG